MKPLVYLASNSPRRVELLQQIDLNPQRIFIDIDESALENELGLDYVKRVTLLKAYAALEHRQKQALPDAPIITADTSVVFQEKILGKPKNAEHAQEILTMLSGHTHQVISSVCVIGSDYCYQDTQITQIQFKHLSPEEIEHYIASGEYRDKAGGYGIQGLGALFVAHLSGSYSGVVGLPLYETTQLLNKAGICLL